MDNKFLATVFLLVVDSCLGQLSGSLSPDFRGGNNFDLSGQRAIGNAKENVVGSFGLSGNTRGGPISKSGAIDYNNGAHSAGIFGSHTPGSEKTFGAQGNLNLINNDRNRFDLNGFASKTHTPTQDIGRFGAGAKFNDHAASITKTNIPGFGSQTRFDANANLFKSNTNKFDANAFKTFNNPKSGPSYGSHGGGLSWNNARGHAASIGFERTPAFRETNGFVSGKANIWQSRDRQTSLDAFGRASKTFSGPNSGRTNFGGGIGLSRRF
ncbi:attacin-B-like [Toxorhynchites rutilus septentrionalis]|uniref:attacin-B-like n=1 Tax=Toxorhynchites rutilus septentrionalis TaxID=329112 RepID=UPI002478419E|nr:attacin-B-like [Toxorhynchites rutilus septentrionalis]